MSANESALVRLFKLLSQSDRRDDVKTLVGAISTTLHEIINNSPLIIEFKSFIINIHDILALSATAVVAELYRVIRYCLLSADHCDVIASQELHWILVASLEVSSTQICCTRTHIRASHLCDYL
jgi:hypothetical protein